MLKERPFAFPLDKTLRVIVDTDCFNECDDQYCVAHMLMTPRFDIKALIAAHYGTHRHTNSEEMSYNEIVNITTLMGIRDEVNILHGAPGAMVDNKTPIDNEGSRFIIEEAMKDDERPLFVCVLGAITNVASALLMKPEIADRMTVIWIGGGKYPNGGREFNQNNDLNAGRAIFQSGVELWQVPSNVYTTMKFSYFEMINKVYPCGELGKYLVENTMRFAEEMKKATLSFGAPGLSKAAKQTIFGGELWSLGDSPCVGIMMNSTMGEFHTEKAPCDLDDNGGYIFDGNGREIRVYDNINSRLILDDMVEKLHFYFG